MPTYEVTANLKLTAINRTAARALAKFLVTDSITLLAVKVVEVREVE